jgi:hypothetical protein
MILLAWGPTAGNRLLLGSVLLATTTAVALVRHLSLHKKGESDDGDIARRRKSDDRDIPG